MKIYETGEEQVEEMFTNIRNYFADSEFLQPKNNIQNSSIAAPSSIGNTDSIFSSMNSECNAEIEVT